MTHKLSISRFSPLLPQVLTHEVALPLHELAAPTAVIGPAQLGLEKPSIYPARTPALCGRNASDLHAALLDTLFIPNRCCETDVQSRFYDGDTYIYIYICGLYNAPATARDQTRHASRRFHGARSTTLRVFHFPFNRRRVGNVCRGHSFTAALLCLAPAGHGPWDSAAASSRRAAALEWHSSVLFAGCLDCSVTDTERCCATEHRLKP